MHRIAEPLSLRLHLRECDQKLEWIPFLDALLIAICFSFLGSPFISAPGLELALPEAKHLDNNTNVRVLTVSHNDLIIFGDRVLNLNEFHKQAQPDKANMDVTLLIKIGKDVSVQTLTGICDAARTAGYKKVQIAAESDISGNAAKR